MFQNRKENKKIMQKIIAGVFTGMFLFSTGIHANAQEISQKGVSFICSLEGFNETCYWDYSQSSIGYGTKCSNSSVQPHKSGLHTITKEEAQDAMQTGIANTYAPKVINQTAGLDLNQNQFDALVSLAYNTGGGLNRIYNSPLVQYARGEITEPQARMEYANYLVNTGGTWNQGLCNRRTKEANYFFDQTCCPPAYARVSLQNNRDIFMTGEDVFFTMHSDQEEIYYLTIRQGDEILYSEKIQSENAIYVKSFDQAGIYTVSCSAGNAYGVTDGGSLEFEIFESVVIPEYPEGDVNQDGVADSQDLQFLQDYLQCKAMLTKEQFEIADMNLDGVCNIFDFLILKRILLLN
ncbi:MAG: glycoside hydrolase family protein [Oscillospiraceae bacterium]|nr:glycoside hydrolase family protein [Oscillospiraceae bacterium]